MHDAVIGTDAIISGSTFVNAAKREGFAAVSARGMSATREFHRPPHHRRQGDEIEAIVFEHALERPGVATAQEAEETRGNLEPTDIANPSDAEERPLQCRQPASAIVGVERCGARAPQAPRRVHHVEVRDSVERHLQAVKQPARLHHRHVKGLTVVGDDEIRVFEELGNGPQQRAFGGMTGEQKLPNLKGAEIEKSATDEKRDRAGPSAQAGGLEIDEDGPRKST